MVRGPVLVTMRRAVAATVMVLALWAQPALAEGRSWTGLRGETPVGDELMQLGEDVITTAGPPAGPPLSGQVSEDRTTALATTLRCPVCQSQSVQDSTSEAARNMRSQVQAMLAAGYDESQVFLYFEHSYGEFIRLMPRAEGFNLLVWAIPVAALVLGLLSVGLVVRRSMGAAATIPAVPAGEEEGDDLQSAPEDPSTDTPADTSGEQDPSIDGSLQPWLDRVPTELAESDG